MYESPIEMISRQMRTQQEDHVYKAVLEVGVTVDKDELIKALQYDRSQYDKGYHDALVASSLFHRDERAEVAREIFEEIEDFILTCIENDEKVYDKGNDDYYDGRFMGFKMIEEHLAKLKKKYTEDQNNEN